VVPINRVGMLADAASRAKSTGSEPTDKSRHAMQPRTPKEAGHAMRPLNHNKAEGQKPTRNAAA
jgi:hypothetical protein